MVFQVGVPPRRIDLLTSLDGVEFAVAWARRTEAELDGLLVPVISRADLIATKRATGRPQDLADHDALGAGDSRWRRPPFRTWGLISWSPLPIERTPLPAI